MMETEIAAKGGRQTGATGREKRQRDWAAEPGGEREGVEASGRKVLKRW